MSIRLAFYSRVPGSSSDASKAITATDKLSARLCVAAESCSSVLVPGQVSIVVDVLKAAAFFDLCRPFRQGTSINHRSEVQEG